jgi:hypothetical protein
MFREPLYELHARAVPMSVKGKRFWISFLAASLVVFTMMVGSSTSAKAVSSASVMPLSSKPFGASYGTWSARWWQYVYQFPIHNPPCITGSPCTAPIYNPLFDETGSQCSLGQSGKVWYLVGVFNVSGIVSRSCTVPSNVALFFPLVNDEFDNLCVDPPLTVDGLRQEAAQAIDTTSELHATLDGAPLSNDLFGFRVTSPVFSYTFPPEDNIAQFLGCDFSGTVYPVVGDGFYLMLTPLSPGQHTINFGGTFGPPFNFSLDITYNLTVTED